MNNLIEAEHIEKSFGGNKALEDISLSVPENSVVSIIGPNGSGKTTFLNCINGIYTPEKGTIRFNGREITGKKVHEIARMGISRTFQVARMFQKISVIDNILAPVLDSPTDMTDLREQALALLERVGMADKKDSLGGELSGGQQKLIELLRVWIMDADLVLLDEPFAGVHPELKSLFYNEILALKDMGKTFILISHDMKSVYTLSDEIIVFDLGKIIAKGSQDDIKNNDQVIEAYLGN